MGAVLPRHRDKCRFVEPRLLVDQRFHEDLDPFQTGAERAYDRDNLLLALHRGRKSIQRQTIGRGLESEKALVRSRRSDGPADISANTQTAALHAKESSFAPATAAGCEIGVVGIDGYAVDVVGRLEVHQCLGLGGAGMEDAAGVPQELEDQAVVRRDLANPGYEAGVEVKAFHRDVLFDADGQAVKRAYRFAMLGVVLVQICCPLEGSFREELSDAVNQFVCQAGALEEGLRNFGAGKFSRCNLLE